MRLTFVDVLGERGTVIDTHVVCYDGRWEQEIQDSVDRAFSRAEPEERRIAEELIISVPEMTPVKAVERTDRSH